MGFVEVARYAKANDGSSAAFAIIGGAKIARACGPMGPPLHSTSALLLAPSSIPRQGCVDSFEISMAETSYLV